MQQVKYLLSQKFIGKASFPKPLQDVISSYVTVLREHQNERMYFPVGNQTYIFDTGTFCDRVEALIADALGGKNITAKDLGNYRGFLRVSRPKAVAERDAQSIQGISSAVLFPGTGWPHDKVFPGITAVIGQMFAGKTYHIENDMSADIFVRLGEPQEDIDGKKNTVGTADVIQALEVSLLFSFLGFRVAVDSLRKLIFSLDGPALSGGITATIFDLLTNINNLFASVGAHAVFTVNPMAANEDAVNRFYELTGASTAGALLLRDQQVVMETYRTETGRVSNIGTEKESRDPENMGPPRPPIPMEKIEDESIRDVRDNSMRTDDIPDEDDELERTGVVFTL